MNYKAAIAALENAAEICETNAPISEREGNADQAALERSNAEDYRKAIEALRAA